MSVSDLPATGFLASATRKAMAEYNGTPEEDDDSPSIEANVGAAAGARSDNAELTGTGSVAGEVLAHRGGLAGCVSADVLDVREGSAHLVAMSHIPFFYSGFGIGASLDRDVRLPLSARRELLDAPVSRAAFHSTVAFIDLALTDHDDHLRVLVMPVTIEQAITTQVTATAMLERHASHVEGDMMRFVSSDKSGNGTLTAFSFAIDDLVVPLGAPEVSMMRLSIMSLAVDQERWGFALDGGLFSIGGSIDCPVSTCQRGYYLASVHGDWRDFSASLHAERSGFLAANDDASFEDRVTSTLALQTKSRTIATSLFAARTTDWITGAKERSVGSHVSVSQSLKHGLTALADGELVQLDRAAARGMVSLAWQTHYQRASRAR